MSQVCPLRPFPATPSTCRTRRRCHRRRCPPIRSSLPFPPEHAKYHRELESAAAAVERACRLCVDAKKTLLSTEGRILEKNDSSPVTVADFGVQALISLELGRLFPSVPLVAEEDSTYLRSMFRDSEIDGDYVGNNVVDSVVNAVGGNVSDELKSLTPDDVLEAIDRGGKDAFRFDRKPATYWLLDPIDGTRGFLRGSDALYVVGLALVVNGKLAIGVMGCPNWRESSHFAGTIEDENKEIKSNDFGPGIIMVAHVGCGTWKRKLSLALDDIHVDWSRCLVTECQLLHEAKFCISDSQTWEALPLSTEFNSSTDADAECIGDEKRVTLLQACCGSLCKYLIIASSRGSVFILQAKAQTKAWDHAAGMICVYEAGGQVSDWRGRQLDLSTDEAERRFIFPDGGVLVTNNILHQQVLDLISSNTSFV